MGYDHQLKGICGKSGIICEVNLAPELVFQFGQVNYGLRHASY